MSRRQAGGVWVFIEQESRLVNSVSWELLGQAQKLAADLKSTVGAVLVGHGVRALAEEVFAFGADYIVLVDHPLLADFRPEPYCQVLSKLVCKHRPDIFLLGATTIGRDLASPVATELATGLTADCTGLEIEPDSKLLLQTRPAFGGNVMATILCAESRPQMATVRSRVFPVPKPQPGCSGTVLDEKVVVDEERIPTKIIEFIPAADETGVEIEKADVLVCGGRGLGSAENFAMLRELASLLNGEVGGSRPAVEMGWLPASCQVGQTGKTIRPSLYIAVGISGSVQHRAGMKDSDTIIAINNDPKAPIFEIADFGIVGNLLAVVPALIEEIRKRRCGRSKLAATGPAENDVTEDV